MSACRPSANFRRSSTKSSASGTPRARPSFQVSRIACSSSQRRSGSARTTPIGARASAVALDRPTRKTNFSQFAFTMSAGISAWMPAFLQASRNACADSRCTGSSGPN